MLVESITLANFRCFGATPTEVELSTEITAVVGPNAAGKTALLQGLAKLFGVSRAQRTIVRSDFHLGPDDDPDDRETKTLFIDVLIGLPELEDGSATPETIAPSFRHVLIDRGDFDGPVCRMRLEANWEDDGTVEGAVTQQTFWVETLDPVPADDKKHPVSATDRGLIQLYYTPASRDAAAQVKATTGALAARLLRAIEWSSETQDAVQETAQSLSEAFEAEAAIEAIGKALQQRWANLHEVRCAGAGRMLVDGAQDRRHDEQRRRRMTVADRVEKAMYRRTEGAQPHQVHVDDVDAELEADEIGALVPDGARQERVQQRAAAQAEVQQVDAGAGCGHGGPDAGGMRGVGAVADRAAMMQPEPLFGRRRGFDRRVAVERDKLGHLVVRQPDFHGLVAVRQIREAQPTGLSRLHGGGEPGISRPPRQIDAQHLASRDAALTGDNAVDRQIVDAVRARRHPDIDALRR